MKKNIVYKGYVKENIKVIERISPFKSNSVLWKCKCLLCGKEYKYRTTKIQSNKKLCVCRRVVDITGKRFGRLVALKYISNKKWLCKCSCGSEKEVIRRHLEKGLTKSCGCLNKEVASERGKKYGMKKAIEAARKKNTKYVGKEGNYRDLFNHYKKRARYRNLTFHLSFDSFTNLIQGVCYYCGIKPSQIHNYHNRPVLYNGIDRIDSNKGYEYGNVVSCCKVCNRSKSVMPQKDFYEHIIKIYNNLIETGK